MDGARRIYLSCIVEKINNNKNYADKIGTKNNSKWKEMGKRNQGEKTNEAYCN